MPVKGLILAVLCSTLAQGLRAEDWITQRGPAISRALERHVLRYADGSEQWFTYGGLTGYAVGWPNVGHWRVREDSYCSRWQEGQEWSCYVLARSADGQRLRFVDAQGKVTEAQVLR